VNLRALAALGLCWALALPAIAQVGGRSNEGLERSRAALAAGQIERAFELARAAAAERPEHPAVWLEVGELADRLRLDAVALRAYQRYLALAPADAENRAEIEGCVRVLQHLVRGGRYVVAEDPERVEALIDWDGHSVRPSPAESVLVDWHGRPHAGEVSLAGADDAEPALISLSHIVGQDASPSLGRALTPP